jgi:hypothetical protein
MKDATEIDFSPLGGELQRQYLTADEIAAATIKPAKNYTNVRRITGISMVAACLLLIAQSYIEAFSPGVMKSWTAFAIAFLVCPAVVSWCVIRFGRQKAPQPLGVGGLDPARMTGLRWLAFIHCNGFQPGVPLAALQAKASLLHQDASHYINVTRSVGISDRAVLMENLLVKRYGVRLSSRNTERNFDTATDYNFLSVRVQLDQYLPHLVIYSRQNPLGDPSFKDLGDKTNVKLANRGLKNQALSLEGKFNDYFEVYMPEGKQIDSLRVLAPDVMLAMVEHGKMYNYEIVDNYLYIFDTADMDNDIVSPAQMQSFWHGAATIVKEFEDQARVYRNDPIA